MSSGGVSEGNGHDTMTIVTTTYRYKPPPKRMGRKLAEITGPTVVTVKGSRRPGPLRGGGQAAAEGSNHHAVAARQSIRPEKADRAQSTTARASDGAHIPANDDRKSAIVTARKPQTWRGDVPGMTPEEHQRRGDAADALFREMKRKVTVAAEEA